LFFPLILLWIVFGALVAALPFVVVAALVMPAGDPAV
jgi:hypothetical protein